MDGEKDRWGDKVRDNERAREDKFFAEREKALLDKLRQDSALADLLTCPNCSKRLTLLEEPPLRLHTCPNGHGWWLTADDVVGLTDPAARSALERLLAGRASGR
jgi:hypothetical protein